MSFGASFNTNDLRTESYPLDWMMEYSLDTVIHLFKTKFGDYFVNIEEEITEEGSEHRRIKDTANNIISLHHYTHIWKSN